MRLLMLATGPFAAPTLGELYNSHHTVAALVTAPLGSHRGKQAAPPGPVRDIAQERGTPILEPEEVNSPAARQQLAACQADLLVVCDYGQILSPATLATARRGGINLHASLLPKYRGAAPINWAIYHGETETGVTIIHMTPQIDAGPCIAQARTPIDPEETAVQLEARLAQIGAALVCRTLDSLETGTWEALPQDQALASKAPRLKKTDGAIDWSRPAQAVKNHVRAMQPWPKTYTYWHRPDGPPLRLILAPVAVIDCDISQAQPGEVLQSAAGRLVVAAGGGAVLLRSVQPAGKRLLAVEEFLRGYHVKVGDLFGPEETGRRAGGR
jgi:methionyl-tRNA formyltransferase